MWEGSHDALLSQRVVASGPRRARKRSAGRDQIKVLDLKVVKLLLVGLMWTDVDWCSLIHK
jgi:hypothetical protein